MNNAITAQRAFICHGRQDAELARHIAIRLHKAGIETSLDLDQVAAGSEFKKQLREQLSESNVIVMLVTPTSLQSDWPMMELGLAEGLGKLVVPVTVGVEHRDLPAPLQSLASVPFDQLDQMIGKLCQRLAGIHEA